MTLLRNGRPALTTDFTAGIGHSPAWVKYSRQGGIAVADEPLVVAETEKGKTHTRWPTHGAGKKLEPDPLYVVYSLVSESSALDYSTFEEWASDQDYDPDSRAAERIYRACLEIALKLRNGIGEQGLTRLREAFQDY